LLDLLPIGVCACDATGSITRYNRKAAEIWGREPAIGHVDELYCGSHRLFWPDGRSLAHGDTPTADAIRTGRRHTDLDVIIQQPSGRRVRVRLTVEPLRDELGAVSGAICCYQDTADRAEERPPNDQKPLPGTIIDATPECVKVVHRDGTLLRINQAGLRMIEADGIEQVEGRSVSGLIADEHRALWMARHQAVCDGHGQTWEFDMIGLRGGRRHMVTHAAPLTLEDGTVAQLAVTHDITERKQNEDAVRLSESRLRQLLDALPNAIYTTDADGRVVFFNHAAAEISGRQPEAGSDRWCVTWKLYRPDGSPLPLDQCPMAVALKERRPVRGEEVIAERPDGTRIPFIPFPTPLFDDSGAMVGGVNMLVDISDRKKAEEHARHLAAIVEFSDDAIVSKDTNGIIQTWNRGAERLFGYKAEEIVGKPVNMLIPADRQDEEPKILDRIRRGERIDHYETVRVRKDGTTLDISLTVSPLKDSNGRVIGASKIARDITERRRQEERRRLLTNELNHRVKNTLATVQSIAAQTFRGEDAPVLQFQMRLIALARAHDVLTRENWEGANLDELVDRTITAIYAEPQRRFYISGPSLRLRPKAALSLSMALHELCTNAAKYGALSNDVGRVTIAWRIDDTGDHSRLRLTWREHGGPAVETPGRKGFGSRLLERALARELRARVKLLFPPDGVVCEIDSPLT
jgi:PAS domain S-box-containing protein